MTIKVLIVEDNQGKLDAIERVIQPTLDCEVEEARSITQAFLQLRRTEYDLVILDMIFQGNMGAGQMAAKEALAGIEVMQYIVKRPYSPSVIVATQHDNFSTPELPDINSVFELDELLRESFPDIYRGVVRVVLAQEKWKEELTVLARRYTNAK
jgi:CheY-like chemotaxis protein